MPALARLPFAAPVAQERTEAIAAQTARLVGTQGPRAAQDAIFALAEENREIHDVKCVNLNPATNVLNPRAEALAAAGLGPRVSLGHAGAKYEMGLEAIEQIEVITTELACELFRASHAEVRVFSGAMANLYAFMATSRPGDTIIAPSADIGGHITHHQPGCAGYYGLTTIGAPLTARGYTVDVDALADLAQEVRPTLITIGGSLNLFPHPVAEVREIADSVGATVLFDAAHLCGMIAGGTWPNPLDEGTHLMTMSTYKSLGGPAGGLLVTRDEEIARAVDAIAYPGMTANFDAGRVAALGVTLADWLAVGADYARAMVANARALADALLSQGIPLFAADRGATTSHQFAILAKDFGGGQAAARRLRRAGILVSGIGLPVEPELAVEGDLPGLRLGTPEVTRRGMTPSDMPALAGLVARGLRADEDAELDTIAADVRAWRAPFTQVLFTA